MNILCRLVVMVMRGFMSDRREWLRRYGRAGGSFKAGALYRLKLGGLSPARALVSSPKDFRIGDASRGEAIMRGEWYFDDAYLLVQPDCAPWGPTFPGLHFADRIHRFCWLRDLIVLGPSGAEHARALVLSWSLSFGRWDSFAWRVDVTADRLVNWLLASPCIFGMLEGESRTRMLECLCRQLRHVRMSFMSCSVPQGRVRSAVALCLAGLSLPGQGRMLQLGLEALERECRVQILEDGGHAGRSPQELAEFLTDLRMTEDMLLRCSVPVPGWLEVVQKRMLCMMRFLSLPGGGHLVAHGGGDGSGGLTAAALGSQGSGMAEMSDGVPGYKRIDAGELCVFMDAGAAPEGVMASNAHAGCLSIFVVDGEDPLIVSCGSHSDSSPGWREAVRGTAGHSALVLDSVNSTQFMVQDRTGITVPVGPPHLAVRQSEGKGRHLLEARHGGWLSQYGFYCRRRLFVSGKGGRVTGEDSLSRPATFGGRGMRLERGFIPYAIRFHLHPDVEVVPGADRSSLYLGIERSGRVWRFRCDGDISMEDSVYAAGGSRRKCRQIVISGEADLAGDSAVLPNRVRWALIRVE